MKKTLRTLLFAVLLLPFALFAQNTLTVADGTNTNSHVPVNGHWVDTYCITQTIYPAGMIESSSPMYSMTGGSITGITYYLDDPASDSWGSAQFAVKIKEVTDTTLSAFVDMTNATTVYTGPLDATQSTMDITFTTPYTYQGGNLLVEIRNTALGTYKTAYFYGISATDASRHGYNNDQTGDSENFIPKTTFTFTGGTIIPPDWPLQLSFNTDDASEYGIATDGQYFYTSNWKALSDSGYSFKKYDLYGGFIEGFNIPGATEIRDLTYDGTYFYGGANGNTIFQMDFANKTLVSTITTEVEQIRHCSYDPTFNGFWVGGWSDLQLVNRAGQILSDEGNDFHSISGSAYDPYSDGGPYLWLFTQPNAECDLIFYKYDIRRHTLIEKPYVICSLLPEGQYSSLSGGAFGTTALPSCPGKFVLIADIQNEPNRIAIFEIANVNVSCEGHSMDNNISVFPNPASSTLNVHAENYDNVQILNSLGQVVYSDKVTENDFRINISGFSKGIYFLRLNGKTTATRKFIKE